MTSPRPAASLLVIGGGIAGASVAYFAALLGWSVVVLDAAAAQASRVPTALLNPVRGPSGRVDPRALAGLRLSWALIADLSRQGHAVPHARCGLLRPVASDAARAKFTANLPPELPHCWLTDAPIFLAPGWPHLLLVSEAGWVAGAALVEALLAASRAEVRLARAVHWDAHSTTLDSGEVLTANAVVWCGGSVGASWGGGTEMHSEMYSGAQMHRAGTLLLLDRAATVIPVSAGVYLAPAQGAAGPDFGVLGATFEAPSAEHRSAGPPLKSLAWLLDGARALTGDASPAVVTGLWTGSRLSGERTGLQAGGWWALAGLGSKGFLLGPLLARELVEALDQGLNPV